MSVKVYMFADLRYPFVDVIVEDFEGTLEQCRDWAFQKTHEMLEFFPKVNILQTKSPWGNKYDFVVMSKQSKHFLSFSFTGV